MRNLISWVHRVLIGLTLAVLGLGALVAEAQPVRHPSQGNPAFVIDLPSGWRAVDEPGGGLKIEQDMFIRGQFLILYMLDRAEDVKDRSLSEIGTRILGGTIYRKHTGVEAGSIAGRKGETYFSSKVDQRVPTDLVLTLVRLDPVHVAAMATVVAQSSTQLERAVLQEIASSIKIIEANQPR